ncbi:MAG: PorP/SprF family type IX secretion system membrane protein [Prevotella sp.]|nr:PorP/SprF family type IX secretion system membrane protein [Prevotella sp.]
MKCKAIILTALVALVSQRAGAQYDAYFSHYFDMQTAYNPAAAGKESKINVTGAYAMALSGFENAPTTAYISGDMPFYFINNVHGVGLQLWSDKTGLHTRQTIDAQYALRKQLGGGWLSVGVQAGLLNMKFEGSKVDVIDTDDPVFKTKSDVDGNALDLGVGLLYQRANWYVGVSGQHVTSPQVKLGEVYKYDVAATWYLHGGVDFQLRHPLFKVSTSAIVRTDGVTYRGDVTGRLIYTYDNRMFYGGVTYSPTNSVTALLGANFHGVVVGYSYEFYTNGIDLKNGTHELFVGYQTDIELTKKGKNRHQTTRTL